MDKMSDHGQLAAVCWQERAAQEAKEEAVFKSNCRILRRSGHFSLRSTFSAMLLLIISISLLTIQEVKVSAEDAFNQQDQSQWAEQFIRDSLGPTIEATNSQASPFDPLSPAGAQFDASKFSNVYEALRAHPDLREFAAMCESRGVKEIVSMDKTALTIFAPIDRALGELLAKSKKRSINLLDLAKNHLAQGFVMPDENIKLPHQFHSYAQLSPLYLNSISGANKQQSAYYVNNAKILATYLIQIEEAADSQFQVLHVIDQPLEFVYVQRRTQLKSQASGVSATAAVSSSSLSSSSLSSNSRVANVRKALKVEDLVESRGADVDEQSWLAVREFQERFADLTSGQWRVDLYKARSTRDSLIKLDTSKLSKLFKFDQEQQSKLGGKLYQLDSSSSGSLNTYFLPIQSEEFDQLLASKSHQELLDTVSTLSAHIIPGKVLFTRTMLLGQLHASNEPYVQLSLAKTLPESLLQMINQTSNEVTNESSGSLSRNLINTPLLLQAKVSSNATESSDHFRSGLTSAEILVANIPISSGVLHLIKRPLVMPTNSLMNFINDHEHQLTNVVQALGSQTSQLVAPKRLEVNRFRELLARVDQQLLASFSQDYAHLNRTILAPTDEAFARLRYDLRALVHNDQLLIPSHWDAAYRQIQLERILKRHLIAGQTLVSNQLTGNTAPVSTLNNFQLSFSLANNQRLQVECDNTRANVIHLDLIGTDGVLHLVDRVLGEEQETLHSLLRSIVIRSGARMAQLESSQSASFVGELSQLVEQQLKSIQLESSSAPSQHLDYQQPADTQSASGQQQHQQQQRHRPELSLISKIVDQYLSELSQEKRQLLGTSVNISFQLARLSSRAENRDDWNERFKMEDKSFTYFAPTDLAWFRLAQQQPELYRPLMYFLDQSSSQPVGFEAPIELQTGDISGGASSGISLQNSEENSHPPRSSESSHRLLQILERHLVGNKQLNANHLNQLETLKTGGGTTLQLVEAPASQLAVNEQQQASSTFAALHSIISGANVAHSINEQQHQVRKALKLQMTTANIVQIHETSNGYLYLIDQVLIQPDDAQYLVQTSSTPAISSSMSSLLGAHNSAILDALSGFFSPSNAPMSANAMITLIGTLTLAIILLALLALVLVVRRRRQSKLNRHQQLESGLTSSSSANSGSTSTTKSL